MPTELKPTEARRSFLSPLSILEAVVVPSTPHCEPPLFLRRHRRSSRTEVEEEEYYSQERSQLEHAQHRAAEGVAQVKRQVWRTGNNFFRCAPPFDINNNNNRLPLLFIASFSSSHLAPGEIHSSVQKVGGLIILISPSSDATTCTV